jgi:disulfide bond formation protein DsbB
MNANLYIALAWLVSLLAVFYSQFTLQLQALLPCTLCWYSWVALYPLVLLLGIATWRNETTIVRYALPLSLLGVVLAGLGQLGGTCTTSPACPVTLIALAVIALLLGLSGWQRSAR